MIREMQHIAPGLEKIVTASLRRVPTGEGPILAWPAACGAAVAARTRAMDFAGGVLRVAVPDASWRVELATLAPRYLAVINRYVGETVRRVEFVVADESLAGRSERAGR